MKNKQKGSAVVIVLLAIIVIILGAGLYIYIQQNKKIDNLIDYSPAVASTTTPPQTPAIEIKPSPASTKNTVPSTSQSLGISFDYPKDYILVDHGTTLVIAKKTDNNSGNIISLSKDIGTVADETTKIKETAESRPAWKLQTSTVTVDNKIGTQFTIDAPAGDLQTKAATAVGIFIQGGNNLYTFRYTCANDNVECLTKSKAVIDSIKFR